MKALVLFSGGLDSTTCLALAAERYGADEVLALSVSYGQKHTKEIDAAKAVAAYYGVKLQTLDLAAIFADSDCSLLKGSSAEIPKESYAEQLSETDGKPVSTYVPFRNGLFLSSAARSFTTAHMRTMPRAMPTPIAVRISTTRSTAPFSSAADSSSALKHRLSGRQRRMSWQRVCACTRPII